MKHKQNETIICWYCGKQLEPAYVNWGNRVLGINTCKEDQNAIPYCDQCEHKFRRELAKTCLQDADILVS